jgi:outer membrane protein assembly factor BamB
VPWAPRTLAGVGLLYSFRQPGTVFFVYGHDGTTARVLAAANARTHRLRYAFDFATFARPPRIAPGEAGFVTEQVVWAREAGGVLYVETAHQTYASSSGGLNGYIAAVDIRTGKALWRTRALVANARTFVLAGDALVTGYGFTREPDYLYLLDRETGRIRDRLLLDSAPQTISRHGKRLTVRTYDHLVTTELRAA